MNGRKDGMASNAGMSRRGFLTGTAVVAAGAALGIFMATRKKPDTDRK